jgi:thiosulfate/3-mercaptopyruvate sulfurtransferase
MNFSQFAPRLALFLLEFGVAMAAILFGFAYSSGGVHAATSGASDPWTSADVVQPADLAQEIREKNPTAPTILYVGFRTLYAGGHITGAVFHGTASSDSGMAEMKKWADTLPRAANLVIYCGCCPFDKCPNVRPAFAALHAMGLTHLRVLALPENFNADWIEKGFPIEKGM